MQYFLRFFLSCRHYFNCDDFFFCTAVLCRSGYQTLANPSGTQAINVCRYIGHRLMPQQQQPQPKKNSQIMSINKRTRQRQRQKQQLKLLFDITVAHLNICLLIWRHSPLRPPLPQCGQSVSLSPVSQTNGQAVRR